MASLHQETDREAAAKPAAATAVHLDIFVNDFVESIVSEVKSELVAETQSNSSHRNVHVEAPLLPASLSFTEGSSAAVSPSPHKARPGALKGTPNKGQSSTNRSAHKPSSASAAQDQGSLQLSSSALSSTAQTELPREDAANKDQTWSPSAQAESSQPQTELFQVQDTSQVSATASSQPAEHKPASLTARTAGGDQAAQSSTAVTDSHTGQATTAGESEAQHVDTVEVVHALVQELLEVVVRHAAPDKVLSADLCLGSESVVQPVCSQCSHSKLTSLQSMPRMSPVLPAHVRTC